MMDTKLTNQHFYRSIAGFMLEFLYIIMWQTTMRPPEFDEVAKQPINIDIRKQMRCLTLPLVVE